MTDEPKPQPGKVGVTPIARVLFLAQLEEQEKKGLAKYGTTLQTHNGRNAAHDAMQELVDAWQYLVQLDLEYRCALGHISQLEKALKDSCCCCGNGEGFTLSGWYPGKECSHDCEVWRLVRSKEVNGESDKG